MHHGERLGRVQRKNLANIDDCFKYSILGDVLLTKTLVFDDENPPLPFVVKQSSVIFSLRTVKDVLSFVVVVFATLPVAAVE